MKDLGAKAPEWTSANGKTVLTIYNGYKIVKMNDRMSAFLQSHKRGYQFGRQEYAGFYENKLSNGTIQNDLSALVKLKKCKVYGKGPGTRYEIL